MLTYQEMRCWCVEDIRTLSEERALELGFLKSKYQTAKFYDQKIDTNGYVQLYVPKEDPLIKLNKIGTKYFGLWIPYHRYIYSEHLGRCLKSWEHIHHKDTDKTNNNFDNLEIWLLGHGVGGRLVDILNSLSKEVIINLISQTNHKELLK